MLLWLASTLGTLRDAVDIHCTRCEEFLFLRQILPLSVQAAGAAVHLGAARAGGGAGAAPRGADSTVQNRVRRAGRAAGGGARRRGACRRRAVPAGAAGGAAGRRRGRGAGLGRFPGGCVTARWEFVPAES